MVGISCLPELLYNDAALDVLSIQHNVRNLLRTVSSLYDRGTMFLLEIKFETVLSAVLHVFINSVIAMQTQLYSARGEKNEGKSSLKKIQP